mmetsp:Transcript_9010/g.20951  ORF Transcript_9010/g.20951 Transcript_9010/m.20951 type:complete len:135 (+) Transcript_9010:222-626(+)
MFGRSNPGRNGTKYSQLPGYSDSDSDDGGEEDFIQREIKAQQMMMKQQDEGLEMLGQSAARLGELSMNIHEEIGHQNKMLDEMEDDLESATTNLGIATAKTKALIQKSGGKRNFIIIVLLTVVVVVLLFLIIYT